MNDGIISALARHKVASNVLMVMFLAAGLWAMTKVNVQFFPDFSTQIVQVRVVWPGASAEDVERSVTALLENELRGVPELREMTSSSSEGSSRVYLEFDESTDFNQALDDVKLMLDRVTSLPSDIDPPEAEKILSEEGLMRLSIVGGDPAELRRLARHFESELLAAGISAVDVNGLPEEEIAILVDNRRLLDLGLTLEDIGARVAAENRDDSAGKIGGTGVERQIRVLGKTSNAAALARIPILANPDGRIVRLGDIAEIRRELREDRSISFNGRPAVELRLKRRTTDNTLETAALAQEWVESARRQLPAGIEMVVHDERWQSVKSRLNLLLENGASGLLIVVLMLYLFVDGRFAFWVAAGIPIAFMGALVALYLVGGSINMISMFAFIMATGIVVDDAIIVSENVLHRVGAREPPLSAVVNGARTMFVPIFASTFTTIAAFLPLFIVGGIIGSIIGDIPLVIVCVLIAAVAECFLILPGHLYGTLRSSATKAVSPFRQRLYGAFEGFQEGRFRSIATAAVRHRGATVTLCLCFVVVAVGLSTFGHLKYRFFPGGRSGHCLRENQLRHGHAEGARP